MAGSNCFNNVFCMWKLFFGQFCSRFWHHWTSWQRKMLVYPLVIWHTYWNMVIYSCFNLLKLTFYSYQPVDWRLNIQGTYRRKLVKSSSSKTSMGIVSKSCGDASLRYRVRSLASGEHVGSKPPTFLGIVWDCICDYMCTYVCMCPHVSTYTSTIHHPNCNIDPNIANFQSTHNKGSYTVNVSCWNVKRWKLNNNQQSWYFKPESSGIGSICAKITLLSGPIGALPTVDRFTCLPIPAYFAVKKPNRFY